MIFSALNLLMSLPVAGSIVFSDSSKIGADWLRCVNSRTSRRPLVLLASLLLQDTLDTRGK